VVDRVHGAGVRVHGTSLNVSHSSSDLRPGLNEPNRYPSLLILAVDTGWAAHGDSAGRGGMTAAARPAHHSGSPE
jgi:hypothetical protein